MATPDTVWAQTKLRYDAVTLRQLTNVNTPGQSSVNDTVGTQAASDACDWFLLVAQSLVDTTKPQHLTLATRATYILLREYSGKFSEQVVREREALEKDLEFLRKREAGKRVMPTTDSTLTPSGQELPGDVPRPYFDNERFDRLTPDGPPAV